MAKLRIGILDGAFNPIHSGHILFALKSIKIAKLDKVVFLPERRPPRKSDVEHFGHRTAMIAQAIKPYNNLELLELPDSSFNTARTLPELSKHFPSTELYFLMGSGNATALNSPNWSAEALKRYFRAGNLIIGLRKTDNLGSLQKSLTELSSQPKEIIILDAPEKDVSSTKIRKALKSNETVDGLLPSVRRYAKNQWLYVSLNEG